MVVPSGQAAWIHQQGGWMERWRGPLALVTGALILSGLLASQPLLAAGLVAGVGLTILILVRPLVALMVLLVIGPIDLSFITGGEKALFAAAGGLDMNGIRLVATVAGFGLLALANRKGRGVLLGPNGRWYVVFLLWALATLSYSWVPMDGVRFFMKLAYPFLLFVAVLSTVRTRSDLERLGTAIMVGAFVVIMVLNPLYVTFGGVLYDSVLNTTRIGGLGIHVATWSFYLLLMLIMALIRFTMRGQLRYLLLAAVCIVWIVLALSRTALVAGAAALALIGLHSALVKRDYRLLNTVLVIGAVLGIAIVPAFMQKTFGTVTPSPGELLDQARDPVTFFQHVSLSGREVFWPIIFLYFLTSPFIGLGLGTTTYLMETQLPESAGGVVHNEYLRLATETGLVGLVLFAFAVLAWGRAVARASLRPESWVLEWTLPALGALAVWAVTGLADNSIDYYAPVSQYVAVLAAGAICAAGLARADAEADRAVTE